MKLFILKIEKPGELDAATPDKYCQWTSNYAHVVRAENEQRARQRISVALDSSNEPWWLDPILVTCTEITADGDEEILLTAYPTG